MAVHNGESSVEETVQSILEQSFQDWEFVIVNDGSTDATGTILKKFARHDSRVRISEVQHCGLTRSLVKGCSLATGTFIARQDCGDISFPGRLENQVSALCDNPEVVLVSSGVETVTPLDEWMFTVVSPGSDLDDGIRNPSPESITGPPHHGATMFRTSAYQQCGGYREVFEVAQDIDLWIRLSELGRFHGINEVHYKARVSPNSISANRHAEQRYFLQLAIESARLRKQERSDYSLFARASKQLQQIRAKQSDNGAEYFYFVYSILARNGSGHAKKYLEMTLKENPLHFRARIRQISGILR